MLTMPAIVGMPRRRSVTPRPRVLIVEQAYVLSSDPHLSTYSQASSLSWWSKQRTVKHRKRQSRDDMNYCTVPLVVQQCAPSKDARAFLDVDYPKWK